MGEVQRRRDERGAPAYDAHPQGRGSHPLLNKVSGGAWLLDRQCNRDGGRAQKWRARMRARVTSACQLGEIAKANPGAAIGSYPFFDPQHGPNTNVVLRAHEHISSRTPKRAVEDMLERLRRAQSRRRSSPSHGENRGSSRLGSASKINNLDQSRVGPTNNRPTIERFGLAVTPDACARFVLSSSGTKIRLPRRRRGSGSKKFP